MPEVAKFLARYAGPIGPQYAKAELAVYVACLVSVLAIAM